MKIVIQANYKVFSIMSEVMSQLFCACAEVTKWLGFRGCSVVHPIIVAITSLPQACAKGSCFIASDTILTPITP